MDASPRRIIELITGAGTRLVIPVFQRPYSWDEEKVNTPEDGHDHCVNSSQYAWLPYKGIIGMDRK